MPAAVRVVDRIRDQSDFAGPLVHGSFLSYDGGSSKFALAPVPAAPVQSVFGRTGAVLAVDGDYSSVSRGGGAVSAAVDGSVVLAPAAGKKVVLSGDLSGSADGAQTIGAGFSNRPFIYAYGLSSDSSIASGQIRWSAGASYGVLVQNGWINLGSGVQFGWGPSNPLAAGNDLTLARDAPGTLAQRNGLNAQTFRLYRTYTDASNGEWLELSYTGASWQVLTRGNGTGTPKNMLLQGGGRVFGLGIVSGTNWGIDSGGNLLTGSDNVYDMGALGANRPRTGYFGTSVNSPTVTLDTLTPRTANVALSSAIDSTGLAFGGTAVTNPLLCQSNPVAGKPAISLYSVGITTWAVLKSGGFYDGPASLLWSSGGNNWWGATNFGSTAYVPVACASFLLAGPSGTSLDVIVTRDAPNTLAQRNGLNAQTFNLYNSYTDASNYSRGFLQCSGGNLLLGYEAAGTGLAGGVTVKYGDSQAVTFLGGGLGSRVLVKPTSTATELCFAYAGLKMAANVVLGWTGTVDNADLTADLNVVRDGPNTLAQRNGANAQTFRLYNSYTDASNREWLEQSWVGGSFTMQNKANGTGTVFRDFLILSGQNLKLGGNGTPSWYFSNVTGGPLLAITDNVSDIGAAGASRPRNVYAAGGVATKVKAGVPADADFTNPVDGMLAVDSADGRLYVRYGGGWHYVAMT